MNMIVVSTESRIRRQASRAVLAAVVGLVALAGAACSPTAAPGAGPGSPLPAEQSKGPESGLPEIEGPRLAVTYDGGILVLDAGDLRQVADVPLPGFLRVNPAGDRRHVLVSTAEGFRVLDTGVVVKGHGDHNHYYGTNPALTNLTYKAAEPGHAVVHEGLVALFSDGTGEVQLVETDKVADGVPVRTYRSPVAHHGVAVPVHDDRLLVSIGTAEARTGAQLVDANGTELARSEECPGLHGEAVAQDEVVAFGCTNGLLLHRDGKFVKATSPDAYARSGNLAGSEASPYILGDYKTDKNATLERPTRVVLVDTRTAKVNVVDLGTSYSFRSLARGPEGEAVVLGTDGALHVLDPATGKHSARIPVVAPWTEPTKWQEARPAVKVADGIAYVTEPSTSSIHLVSLAQGKVIHTAKLAKVPNEVALWV